MPNDAAVALMNQVKRGKTVHAYLFVGSRGTGKTTTARVLAKALNCTDLRKVGDPCDKCENCVAIRNGVFLDLSEIDAASNRGIDDIRELRDRVKLAPSVGACKVYIIDEVHMLTTEAFNALLKTLEEPPRHCVFILCTTELHKVPDTIKSRCQVFSFKRATIKQLVSRLSDIAKKEKAEISKKKLEAIARAASGGFRDAETILQQVIEGDLDITSFLSVASKEGYVDFIDYILQKDANLAFRHVDKAFENGVDLYTWAGGLVMYLRDLLFIKANAQGALIDVSEDVLLSMGKQSSAFSTHDLVRAIERFIGAQNDTKVLTIPQLSLELAIAELCLNSNDSHAQIQDNPITSPGDATKVKGQYKKPISPQNTAKPTLDFSRVEKDWSSVLDAAVDYNSSVLALLKMAKPVATRGNNVVLEVVYAFHKERLESPKNIKIVEKVLNDVFDLPVSVECEVNKSKQKKRGGNGEGDDELTDYNVVVPSSDEREVLDGSLVKVFDGGLPLG